MAKIVSIEGDVTFSMGKWSSYDGYLIKCDDGNEVKVGICNSQCCCENWGYFSSNDDFNDFIGAEVLSVAVVDDALTTTVVPDLYDGSCMFVNIETDKGLFQLACYNEHNGYYSHEAVVVENGVVTETQSL